MKNKNRLVAWMLAALGFGVTLGSVGGCAPRASKSPVAESVVDFVELQRIMYGPQRTSFDPNKPVRERAANPLVLIDGVEGDINSLTPENIESFQVLKDESQTAPYGERGKNGVILIVTKKK